jgi:hypothetical protein
MVERGDVVVKTEERAKQPQTDAQGKPLKPPAKPPAATPPSTHPPRPTPTPTGSARSAPPAHPSCRRIS